MCLFVCFCPYLVLSQRPQMKTEAKMIVQIQRLFTGSKISSVFQEGHPRVFSLAGFFPRTLTKSPCKNQGGSSKRQLPDWSICSRQRWRQQWSLFIKGLLWAVWWWSLPTCSTILPDGSCFLHSSGDAQGEGVTHALSHRECGWCRSVRFQSTGQCGQQCMSLQQCSVTKHPQMQ